MTFRGVTDFTEKRSQWQLRYVALNVDRRLPCLLDIHDPLCTFKGSRAFNITPARSIWKWHPNIDRKEGKVWKSLIPNKSWLTWISLAANKFGYFCFVPRRVQQFQPVSSLISMAITDLEILLHCIHFTATLQEFIGNVLSYFVGVSPMVLGIWLPC